LASQGSRAFPKDGTVATLQYHLAPPEVFAAETAMKVWAKKGLLAAQQDFASKRRAPKAKRGAA
jgi:TfoX/Sxy family transcriptional regulator of competence genes